MATASGSGIWKWHAVVYTSTLARSRAERCKASRDKEGGEQEELEWGWAILIYYYILSYSII